jgi:hypothetical protein
VTTDDGPIFLAGLDRSGIGLLGELLEAHPNIAITRRINFWSFYDERFGDLSQPANLDRCLDAMLRYSRIAVLEPDRARLRTEFLKGERTYARLFAILQEQNARRLGKSRWGDKSLKTEQYADVILAAYPAAKMIHLVRDPRDRYASQLTHRGVGRGWVGAGAAMWLWSARLGERNERRYSDRYRVVRYESLVSDPVEVFSAILEFVGEEYVQGLVRGADDPAEETLIVDDPRMARIVGTASVGRFRTVLSARDVAFLQAILRPIVERFGYENVRVVMSTSDLVRFVVWDVPLNLARMVAWRAGMAARQKLGRRPSARRMTVYLVAVEQPGGVNLGFCV